MKYVQAFQCASCSTVCEWRTRVPIEFGDNVEVKTIGSMYCNALACIEAEAAIHGLPVHVIHWIGGKQAGREDLVFVNERLRALLVLALSWWSRRQRPGALAVDDVERHDYNTCVGAARGGPVDVTADRARAEMVRAREKVEELEGLLAAERSISLERLAELERLRGMDGPFWMAAAASARGALNAIADRLGVVHEDDKIKAAVFDKLDGHAAQLDQVRDELRAARGDVAALRARVFDGAS